MRDERIITAMGTMSGTSLDGVDAAILRTDGRRIDVFGEGAYRPYSEVERATLRAALGRWPGTGLNDAARVVLDAHTEVMNRLGPAEICGFHGQTLAHDPRGQGTHQLGDGEELAARLGLPVAWDFRSEDIRQGGEGAPLAPVFHHACAIWAGVSEPVAFLNLGGVGNLTYVNPTFEPENAGALLAFDTGPANAPLNDLMQSRFGRDIDVGGALSASGVTDAEVMAAFAAHPYFRRPPPKSLDRDDFPSLLAAVEGLGDADAAATLAAAAVHGVIVGLKACPSAPTRLLVTGGGRHNAALMAGLSAGADCPVEPVEAIGLDGDLLEAQAFAFLAVRVLRGLPNSFPSTTGARHPVSGGRISSP
ncbi:anhydro-N-acetylmuramic acid kinase [Poseidonocella pacifica]|uniref:Anhydro-N-acetylmuramic acid kinase n=1 Tax=Poseidonocella pacifica TaxID=871651 RepID=A0A1I0VKD3_9RHOB|nr:anhydro-N-acetylmuramic acid kinase [Poseidonocella pacifica]SFA76658.1 anhydro-N-acetylmuramic acid kinase [Poseidonocella pacifica]